MKITLTSSLGNIGRPLTAQLVKEGHEVSVISHTTKRRIEIEKLNATPLIGSLEDLDFIGSAFAKADAVFLMNPSDYSKPDVREYYRKTTSIYAEALRNTKNKRVVLLSSFGAHLSHGTGPILGSHFSEEVIKQIPNIDLTILRPTYFYYNLNNYVEMIRYTGQIIANYGSDKFPLVSPVDIADIAAQELVHKSNTLYRYIVSSEHTGQEIATAIGSAIGQPDLKWVIVNDEVIKKGMTDNGVPLFLATLLTSMYSSLENGRLTEDYKIHKPEHIGKVSLKDFVKDFARLFHQ